MANVRNIYNEVVFTFQLNVSVSYSQITVKHGHQPFNLKKRRMDEKGLRATLAGLEFEYPIQV